MVWINAKCIRRSVTAASTIRCWVTLGTVYENKVWNPESVKELLVMSVASGCILLFASLMFAGVCKSGAASHSSINCLKRIVFSFAKRNLTSVKGLLYFFFKIFAQNSVLAVSITHGWCCSQRSATAQISGSERIKHPLHSFPCAGILIRTSQLPKAFLCISPVVFNQDYIFY